MFGAERLGYHPTAGVLMVQLCYVADKEYTIPFEKWYGGQLAEEVAHGAESVALCLLRGSRSR